MRGISPNYISQFHPPCAKRLLGQGIGLLEVPRLHALTETLKLTPQKQRRIGYWIDHSGEYRGMGEIRVVGKKDWNSAEFLRPKDPFAQSAEKFGDREAPKD